MFDAARIVIGETHVTVDQIGQGTSEGERGGASLGRSLAALDGLNFFLADVQSGLGPFLGIYLLTVPGWNPAGIGLVLTIGGIVGLFVQTPIGALIDRTRHKRTLIIIAAALTSVGAFMITITLSYAVITTAQVVTGMAGAVFPPAIAAIALGLVGARNYTYRTGRMAAFNHAGNVIGATIAGLAGYLITIRAGFWFASIVGILVIIATLLINRRLINHDVARGLTPRNAAMADAPGAENPPASPYCCGRARCSCFPRRACSGNSPTARCCRSWVRNSRCTTPVRAPCSRPRSSSSRNW
ncbi:MAG: hypothetical protein DLM60_20675 [Pseudonocardiales bacterium]|nr:MAG: hypothetical protein DLM60_20675 [Pseudonocardiales bacterium]